MKLSKSTTILSVLLFFAPIQILGFRPMPPGGNRFGGPPGRQPQYGQASPPNRPGPYGAQRGGPPPQRGGFQQRGPGQPPVIGGHRPMNGGNQARYRRQPAGRPAGPPPSRFAPIGGAAANSRGRWAPPPSQHGAGAGPMSPAGGPGDMQGGFGGPTQGNDPYDGGDAGQGPYQGGFAGDAGMVNGGFDQFGGGAEGAGFPGGEQDAAASLDY